MNDKTFGDVIVELRKSKGLTQKDLADKLNITDKAVSKWERNLSYPDITSISKLANTLGVETSYLIDLCKKEDNPYSDNEEKKKLINLICNAIAIAMSIAVIVLSILNKLNTKDSITMLGIGLFCLSITMINKEK